MGLPVSFVDWSPRSAPGRQRPRLGSRLRPLHACAPGYRPASAALSDGEAIQSNAWTSEQVVTVAAAPISTTSTASASSSTHKSKGGRRSVKPELSNYLRYTLSPNATTSADALNLFIHAGHYAASSGTFSVATDKTIANPLVDVTMKYRGAYALNITQVCLMRKP